MHETTYILTTDNTRDKFSAEADRKITVNEDIPGDVYGIYKEQKEEMIRVMLGIYAEINYVSDANVYKEIEVCTYRKRAEENEVTIN